MYYYLLFSLFFITTVFAQDEFFEPKTTIGGYGELHYNYSKTEDSDPQKKLDFHRFVLFLSHSWTEKWSFKSEIELEHNFVKDDDGELEIEQAYINYHHNDAFGFQLGVVLPSLGFLNEFHEPPLFLSVERPDYSKSIIPTTWFGNGAAVYGNLSDFSYKLVVMEGLNGAKFSAEGIRSGRQKGHEANAEQLLYNARVDYNKINGLQVGGSFSFNDAVAGADSTIATTIFEIHARYSANNFFSVFEFGNISYDGLDAGFNVEQSVGYYFDLGYDIAGLIGVDGQFIPWFRYTDYNTAASVKGGGDIQQAYHYTKWLLGTTAKPIDQIVFKVDYGVKTNEKSDVENTQFNFAAGYMF